MENMNIKQEQKTENEQVPAFFSGVFDVVEMIVLTLLTVILITTFGVRHSIVNGSSMDKTLYNGEHMLITPLSSIEAGDIIVFEDFSTRYKEPLVKRVIATEGQTVYLVSGTEVYVDGVLLEEDYVYLDTTVGGTPRKDNYSYPKSYTVGKGEIFVMGDHRNGSADSRDFGCVKLDTVLGKVILTFGNKKD